FFLILRSKNLSKTTYIFFTSIGKIFAKIQPAKIYFLSHLLFNHPDVISKVLNNQNTLYFGQTTAQW
ncbi:MAG: hypothetical protein ACK4IY_04755, partial [Chitinophagales bacterium]